MAAPEIAELGDGTINVTCMANVYQPHRFGHTDGPTY
jgi:hypothetical protein